MILEKQKTKLLPCFASLFIKKRQFLMLNFHFLKLLLFPPEPASAAAGLTMMKIKLIRNRNRQISMVTYPTGQRAYTLCPVLFNYFSYSIELPYGIIILYDYVIKHRRTIYERKPKENLNNRR